MTELVNTTQDASTLSLPPINNKNYGIVIPCEVEKFSEFLTGLLGKPQSIKGEKEGIFNVDLKQISNVFHLIDQRISEQNDGTLANLEIKVTYDNGISVSHDSIKDFEEYYPTLHAKPEEVVLSFTYLIKFQRSETPQKQEIEFVFNTSPNKRGSRSKWYAGGLIEWSIKHTERTWASDINGLLKNHASRCLESNSGIWKWLTKYYEEIIHYFGLIIIFSVIGQWLFSTLSFLDSAPPLIQIIKYYTISFSVIFTLYFFISSIVRTISVYLLVRRNSYICLIDQDDEYKSKDIRKTFWRLLIYVISFLVAIASSIIATMIYESQWATGII